MSRYLFIIVAVLCLLTGAAHAQEFNIQSIERIKSEFMRLQMPTAGAASQQQSKSAETIIRQAPAAEAEAAAKGVKLPSAQDVLAKSGVAHIDPETYVLGPGDVLNVYQYGMIQQQTKVDVQPDGTIFIPPMPPIHVEDLTLAQARRKIEGVMRRYYKNFKVEVQLLDLRSFQVEILGEVESPGTYIITPVVGVCDAIGLAGGLKKEASLRNITIIDDRLKKKTRVDIFSWYYLGKKKENRLLNRRQTVQVPLMQKRVVVEGAFKRQGNFEITPGETLSDMLRMVEPDTGAVLKEGKLTRISGTSQLKVIPVDMAEAYKNRKSAENLLLVDGDTIFVPDLTVFLKKITVIGELKGANLFGKTVNRLTGQEELLKVGLYNMKEGEKVKDVLINLGGVTAQADMEKARVERPLGDGRVQVIPVDLRRLMYENDENENIALAAGDSFIVPAKATNIYIVGEVRSPGAYQYNVGNKLKEYIALAGGPTRRARVKNTKVIQHFGDKMEIKTVDLRSIMTGNLPETFELRPGDIIYVPYAEVANYRDIVSIITDLIVLRQLFK